MPQDHHPRDSEGEERPEYDEPETDPDSEVRLAEERPDAPHGPTRFDAGNGQGTVFGPPYGEDLQERPILDGSTQSDAAEATVPNPYRGETDPAMLKRQPALNNTSSNRWLIASIVAAVILSAVLLLLARWSPMWCGIGVLVILVGLVLLLIVRVSGLPLRRRLRFEATLLGVICLVPLAVILSVLIGSAEQIW